MAKEHMTRHNYRFAPEYKVNVARLKEIERELRWPETDKLKAMCKDMHQKTVVGMTLQEERDAIKQKAIDDIFTVARAIGAKHLWIGSHELVGDPDTKFYNNPNDKSAWNYDWPSRVIADALGLMSCGNGCQAQFKEPARLFLPEEYVGEFWSVHYRKILKNKTAINKIKKHWVCSRTRP